MSTSQRRYYIMCTTINSYQSAIVHLSLQNGLRPIDIARSKGHSNIVCILEKANKQLCIVPQHTLHISPPDCILTLQYTSFLEFIIESFIAWPFPVSIQINNFNTHACTQVEWTKLMLKLKTVCVNISSTSRLDGIRIHQYTKWLRNLY